MNFHLFGRERKVYYQYELTNEKYSENIHFIINKLLNKTNPVLFEIGASDGNDSLEFLEDFRDIQLYCFEADPRAVTIHEKYVKDDRCNLYKGVVSDTNDDVLFYLGNLVHYKEPKLHLRKLWHAGRSDRYEVFKESNDIYNDIFELELSGNKDKRTENGWYYSSSINKVNVQNTIKQEHSIMTNSITLDTFCQEYEIDMIDFLIITAEGAENKIIEGAKNTLKKTNYVMLEIQKSLYTESMNQYTATRLMLMNNFSFFKKIGNNVIFINKGWVEEIQKKREEEIDNQKKTKKIDPNTHGLDNYNYNNLPPKTENTESNKLSKKKYAGQNIATGFIEGKVGSSKLAATSRTNANKDLLDFLDDF